MAYARIPFWATGQGKPQKPAYRTRTTSSTKAVSTGFATSPAGRHKQVAKNCFSLAKRAKASGNNQHYWAMLKLGKQALALSNAEYAMWKYGQALKKRSFAVQRAAVSR